MDAVAPRAHARLGGSSASIFLNCPGAPARWPGGKGGRGSHFAAEGTLAHHLAEDLLNGRPVPKLGTRHLVDGFSIELTQEMIDAVYGYVRDIEQATLRATWAVIEQEFDLGPLWTDHGQTPPEPMFGIADFVGVNINSEVLAVHDLKFGKGVPVRAERNPQLLYYGLGAWLWLKDNEPELAGRIRYVELHIHQPRAIGHTGWRIDLLDLLLWGDFTLKRTVDKIARGDTYLHAGTHCRFCPAAPHCPELQRQAQAAAVLVFPDLPPDEPNLKPADELTDAEIGQALSRAEMLSAWLSHLRREAQARIAQGHDVDGWKLVTRRANRRWRDASTLPSACLSLGLPPGFLMAPPEPLTPAAAERRLKADGYRPAVLAPLIETPAAGLTLVPAGDPRPAVDITPDTVFPDDLETDPDA